MCVCVCVWLDLSRFVGIEKHLEISGDAYVSLLQLRHLEIIGAGLSFVPEIFLHFFFEALGFFSKV